MKVRIVGPFADLELRTATASSLLDAPTVPGAAPTVFDTLGSALALLRPALQIDPAQASLRALLHELGAPIVAQLDDDQLLHAVARELVSGRLELVEHPHELLLTDPDSLAAQLSARSLRGIINRIEDEDHWIEVYVGTEAGEPLPGVRCDITLPWGMTLQRRTNGFGIVRLDHLAMTGDCVIAFPDFAANKDPDDPSEAWDVLAEASGS